MWKELILVEKQRSKMRKEGPERRNLMIVTTWKYRQVTGWDSRFLFRGRERCGGGRKMSKMIWVSLGVGTTCEEGAIVGRNGRLSVFVFTIKG